MSQTSDLERLLNTPSGPLPPSALGEKATTEAGKAQRLALTPAQAKEKALKGKLFLRNETGTYKLGPPERPHYLHDNGHLGDPGMPLTPLRKPTEADKRMFETFVARLQVGEMMCNDRENKRDWPWQNRQRFVPPCGGNQPDANMAFRNFLFGNGKSRRINYERYLKEQDTILGVAAGTHAAVKTLILDFIAHAEAIGVNRQRFSITSKHMYGIGDEVFAVGPKNMNWRRTLGAHVIWISGNLTAESAPKGTHIIYRGELTFEVEDIFNFNPHSSDGPLGILDREGGMLELSGLGKQFMTYATFYRHIEWSEQNPASLKISIPPSSAATPAFIEDHEKEEAALKKRQAEMGARFYTTGWDEIGKKAWKHLFNGD